MRWLILHDSRFDRWLFNWLFISGWLAGLFYSATWLRTLSRFLMSGNIFAGLILVSVYLVIQDIWQRRDLLPDSKRIPKVQRSIGFSLILVGLAFFLTSLNYVWSQALGWTIILSGLVLSQWGLSFFKIYRQSVILLLLSLYPGSNVGAEWLWGMLTPPQAFGKRGGLDDESYFTNLGDCFAAGRGYDLFL